MQIEIAKALIYALENSNMEINAPYVIGGDAGHFTSAFKSGFATVFSKSQFDGWQPAKGWEVRPEYFAPANHDGVIVTGFKSQEEGMVFLAHGLQAAMVKTLPFMAVMPNLEGGKRLVAMLADFGLQCEDISKSKCRVVIARNFINLRQDILASYLKQSAPFERADGMLSAIGLFAAGHIDKASAMLIDYFKGQGGVDLKGLGADFGCGQGALSLALCQNSGGIEKLYALEDDYRAIACCTANCKGLQVEVQWHDVTKKPALPPLDFVVMNPPFHAGNVQDISLGQSFIKTAFAALKNKGVLQMVANTHLPYEKIIAALFSSYEIVHVQFGFKIIRAVK